MRSETAAYLWSEATDNTAVIFAPIFLFSFSAHKSHVKPQNRLTHGAPTTSVWHVSYLETAILNIEIKKEEAPESLRG
jgi:hypothetical protein